MKRKDWYNILALLVLHLWLLSCNSSIADTRFIFNLQKDRSYAYTIEWDMTQQAADDTSVVRVSSAYQLDVIDIDDDIRTITTTYKNMQVGMNMMGVDIRVDTRQPFADSTEDHLEIPELVSRMFYALKGNSFTMKVNTEGKVLEVKGLDQVEAAIVNSLGLPEEFKESIQLMFRQQFNEKNIRDQFERVLFIFPGKAIKQGDTWDKVTESGGVSYNSHYTVQSIEGDHTTLQLKTLIRSDQDGVTMKGEQSGILKVEKKTGLMTSGDFEGLIRSDNGDMKMVIISNGMIKGEVVR
jgi:hypothetical protein